MSYEPGHFTLCCYFGLWIFDLRLFAISAKNSLLQGVITARESSQATVPVGAEDS
jgi:hypothetical protein